MAMRKAGEVGGEGAGVGKLQEMCLRLPDGGTRCWAGGELSALYRRLLDDLELLGFVEVSGESVVLKADWLASRLPECFQLFRALL